MNLLKSDKGISGKNIFLLGALGIATTILICVPKKIKVINIGNLYINKEEKEECKSNV